MKSNKQLQIAYRLAGICLVVGIVAYVAFPEPDPDPPLRVMYEAVAGNVLFDHETHSTPEGYALACNDCHHNLMEGETEPEACGACHEPDGEDPIKRSDALHEQCGGCHADFGSGPAKDQCGSCHAM